MNFYPYPAIKLLRFLSTHASYTCTFIKKKIDVRLVIQALHYRLQ